MWHPIHSDEIEAKVRASIYDIASELSAMETSSMSAFELGEHALLYAYLALDKPFDGWQDKSLYYLNLSIELLSLTQSFQKGLYGGLSGFGWIVQHTFSILSDGAEQESEEDDALFEVDKRILQLGDQDAFGQDYDLISGYVGIGIYWLERLPRKNALLGLRQTLNALDRISEITPDGIAWFTPCSLVPPIQIDLAPWGYYNLGVAHGVPGVIGFLVQVATVGLEEGITNKACLMLEGAIAWLLAQQRSPNSISRYSNWMIAGQDCGDTWLSWCYGDLGIAAVLQFVGQRARNSSWMAEAKNLMARCVPRESNSKEVSLCHGTVGIAHMYNRAYQTYHEDAYKIAARGWIQRSLVMRKLGIGVAGYYAWNPSSVPHEQPDTSFLSGVVGVALALLSTVSPIEPQWDRMMLLSGVRSIAK